ncbi:NAD-dependent epimerase/dehydratase family protein [Candidatus Bathyarchaeota archaeon]|nr:MAG: NAD-dependent epimerase/dehydratase family protein [Candidatus Bathyarchaeota archaeon]
MNALVTGGCGFFGSHLTEALVRSGRNVTVLDNLSFGSKRNLRALSRERSNGQLRLIVGDCTNPSDVKRALLDVDSVFHMAACPEVRDGLRDPATSFRVNVYGTHVLLEQMRKSSAARIVFPSTSSVYGEAKLMPTPEDYSPLQPISLYGATKLAAEALISSYAHTYARRALILRFANIVGARAIHGVTVDFIRRLQRNPSELKILGDGTQSKSYIHISDCTNAVLNALELNGRLIEVYNVGSEDQVTVLKIARIVVEEMGLGKVSVVFSKGSNGGGWVGDVKNMHLDITKLRSKGWAPHYGSEDAVRLATRELAGAIRSVSADNIRTHNSPGT